MKTRPQTDLTQIRNQEDLRKLAGFLRRHADGEDEYCYAPTALLASELRLPVSTITRYLACLEEIGAIKIEHTPGMMRGFKVLLTAAQLRKILAEGNRA